MTIVVPDYLGMRLQQQALAENRSVEAVVSELLSIALARIIPSADVLDVVMRIQSLPPNPLNIRPAAGSLADALRAEPVAPSFDLDQWERDWGAVETEIRAMNGRDTGS